MHKDPPAPPPTGAELRLAEIVNAPASISPRLFDDRFATEDQKRTHDEAAAKGKRERDELLEETNRLALTIACEKKGLNPNDYEPTPVAQFSHSIDIPALTTYHPADIVSDWYQMDWMGQHMSKTGKQLFRRTDAQPCPAEELRANTMKWVGVARAIYSVPSSILHPLPWLQEIERIRRRIGTPEERTAIANALTELENFYQARNWNVPEAAGSSQ